MRNFLNNYPFFYTLSFSTNSLLVLEREHLLSEDNPFPRRTIARFTARSSIPITVTARKVEAGGIFVSKGSRYADIPGKLVSFVNWLRGEGGLFLSSRETRRMAEEKGERRKKGREYSRWREEMRSFNGAFTSWKFQVLFPSRGEEIHCGDIDRSRGIYESLQLFLLLPRPRNNYHAFEHPSLTDLTNSHPPVTRFTCC